MKINDRLAEPLSIIGFLIIILLLFIAVFIIFYYYDSLYWVVK